MKLDVNEKGLPKLNTNNFLTILETDPKYKGNLKYNVIKDRYDFFNGNAIEHWDDRQTARERVYIEKKYGIYSRQKLEDAMIEVFSKNAYNPILDKIKDCKWDGKQRVESFLADIMKTERTAYTSEVSRLIFAGAINRLITPGCKFDEVPVFEGLQGCGKSTIVRWLAIDDDYFNELKEVNDQRAVESVQAHLIIEISEMLALTKSKEVEAVKSFVSRLDDKYRRPYAKVETSCPRKCIMIGTTNKTQFLTDKTGNRRFLPIKVNSKAEDLYTNEKFVKAYILQCWSEIYFAYTNKLPLALAVMKKEIRETSKEKQSEVVEDDFRIGLIQDYLENKIKNGLNKVCTIEIWTNVFEGLKKDLKPKDSSEISLIMQNSGWVKSNKALRFTEFGVQKGWIYEPTNLKNVTNFNA